ncbi:MAG: Ig-like domain-containing protein [Gemmatimonadetes bacterium]|nr:Ig-like domain-containing protein [Candidatus Palauibacter rhopaloidicola]
MPPPPPPPPPPAVPPTQVGSIPAQIVDVDESAVIDVAAYFFDPDGGPLSYAASTSSPAVVSVSMSGSSLTMVGVADGTATVTVMATDPQGLSAAQSVGVTVQTPNRAPVPSGSIPAQSLNPGRAVTLDVARYFSDPDGDALTYGATTAVPRVVSVSMSGSRLTMVGVADGAAAVVVTATDPSGLIATQSVGVSVQTPNRAPAPIGSIPAQSLSPGRTATLDVTSYFSDPDGDALRYTAASSNADAVSVGVSGSSLMLTGVADGRATVTVTATDPGGLAATQSVGVRVQTPNRAPATSGSIPAQSIIPGRTATLDVVHYFRDPDGDALRYWATTSNAAVVSVSMSGSRLTMVGVAHGTATVTVTASDPDGLSAMQRVGVTVETPNRAPAPSGSIPAQSLDPRQTARLDVARYFSDPDGDALRYAATTSNAGVVSASVSGSTVTLTAVSPGTATVTVTATDPAGLSATQSVSVTVQPPNRTPAPSGSIPAQSVDAGRSATLDVAQYFSDPDGDTLGFAATTSNAAVVSVDVSGSTVTFTGVALGTATVTVTATDPDGLSATQSVSVTVETPNRAPAPSGSIPARTIGPGRAERLDVARYFSDPDGDALTFAATTSNAAVVSADVSGSTLTLTAGTLGTATVTVTATDPDGLSATQDVDVTVTSNRAPVPSGSIPAQNLGAGRSVSFNVARYFSDPDGDALTYSAETSNAGVVSRWLSRSNLTLVGVAGGEATVTVTATDPGGLTGTQTIEVSVRGRVAGFRDDFEASANLQDWRVQNADATVAATATDSALHLTNLVTGTPGTAARSSPPRLRGWELSTEISRVTREANPGVIWFTGHDRFSAFRLLLPTSRTRNYEFAVFDAAENGWIVMEDLSGHSRQLAAAPNAFDQIRLGHDEAGYFVFEIGGGDFASTFFRVNPDTPLGGVRLGDVLERLVDIWLVNQGAIDATAVFEWVEVSGEEVAATAGDAGAPPGVDQVKAAAGAPAANRVRLPGGVEVLGRRPR